MLLTGYTSSSLIKEVRQESWLTTGFGDVFTACLLEWPVLYHPCHLSDGRFDHQGVQNMPFESIELGYDIHPSRRGPKKEHNVDQIASERLRRSLSTEGTAYRDPRNLAPPKGIQQAVYSDIIDILCASADLASISDDAWVSHRNENKIWRKFEVLLRQYGEDLESRNPRPDAETHANQLNLDVARTIIGRSMLIASCVTLFVFSPTSVLKRSDFHSRESRDRPLASQTGLPAARLAVHRVKMMMYIVESNPKYGEDTERQTLHAAAAEANSARPDPESIEEFLIEGAPYEKFLMRFAQFARLGQESSESHLTKSSENLLSPPSHLSRLEPQVEIDEQMPAVEIVARPDLGTQLSEVSNHESIPTERTPLLAKPPAPHQYSLLAYLWKLARMVLFMPRLVSAPGKMMRIRFNCSCGRTFTALTPDQVYSPTLHL